MVHELELIVKNTFASWSNSSSRFLKMAAFVRGNRVIPKYWSNLSIRFMVPTANKRNFSKSHLNLIFPQNIIIFYAFTIED